MIGLYEVTVVLDRAPTDSEVGALLEGGLYTVSPVAGAEPGTVHVERPADSLLTAVADVVECAGKAGLKVVRLDDEDLVGLWAVERRVGHTREGDRLLTARRHGRGDFPAPQSGKGVKALYSWIEVEAWAVRHGLHTPTALRERALAAANHILAAADLLGLEPASLLRRVTSRV
jgi:hypothetical protein